MQQHATTWVHGRRLHADSQKIDMTSQECMSLLHVACSSHICSSSNYAKDPATAWDAKRSLESANLELQKLLVIRMMSRWQPQIYWIWWVWSKEILFSQKQIAPASEKTGVMLIMAQWSPRISRGSAFCPRKTLNFSHLYWKLPQVDFASCCWMLDGHDTLQLQQVNTCKIGWCAA